MRWSELPLAAFLSSVTAATQVAAIEGALFLFPLEGTAPMSLSNLLLELIPLCESLDDNWEQVVSLLDAHQDLAEYEVARFYVSRFTARTLGQLVRSDDPRQRVKSAHLVRLTCTQRKAGQFLRLLIKDPCARVRSAAHRAMRGLRLDDVALPDSRIKKPHHYRGQLLGGWNPSGWSYGLFGNMWSIRQYRKQSRRPKTTLAELGIPKLETRKDVLSWLKLGSIRDLRKLLRAGSGPGSPYVSFTIPKASGEPRTITAPRLTLRRVQRQILDELLSKLPTHTAAHGFVKKRSVVTNAKPHESSQLVVKLDLKDFFPTISYHRVRGLLCRYGFSPEVADTLAGLTTHRAVLSDGYVVWPGVLPQGAPTSPVLANLICRRLDSRLSGLAKRMGARYTRYADDLTFSFAKGLDHKNDLGRFLWWVNQVCQQEGFAENVGKRKILRPSAQQRITGVVVNSGLSVPRAMRRTFRAILHNCRMHGLDSQARGRRDFRAYLLGYASYIQMVQPSLGKRVLAEVRALLTASDRPST
jgi:RNA-directed DNA polymerase